MKTRYNILISILVLLLFASCEKKQNNELIKTYLPFNAPVSCISIPQQYEDSIYYAGLENGNIVRVNFRTDDRQLIATSFANRIYDIIQEEDTLWLGIRNLGLVKWSLKKNAIERSYKILIPDLADKITSNFAPYDIEIDPNGTLFMGTSSGVYRLSKEERNNDTLTTLYRPHDIEVQHHFGVNQLKICGDSIFCATVSGLVILDRKQDYQEKTPYLKKQFSHLYPANDSILYASSDFMLYTINKYSGALLDSVAIPNGNLFAYIADASKYNGKWEFTATQINYSNDYGNMPPVSLPEKLDKNYRNYLCLGKDFLFFSQGMKVYSLALHQNPKGKSNYIDAAHTIDNVCYFISSDHYLYSYSLSDNKENVVLMGSIGNLESGENIIRMCSAGYKFLWFITDKQHLYKIDLKPSFLRQLNPFRKTYEAVQDALNADFKSIFYEGGDKNNLYVGSRYVLYKIHNPENEKSRKIDIFDISSPKNDLYVTNIGEYDNEIFISSLNHGLLKVNENSLETVNNAVGSIYNMISIENRGVLLHSSKGIFYEKQGLEKSGFSTNEQTKSIYSIYQKCYIGYSGIGLMIIGDTIGLRKLSNLDISFNKAAMTKGIRENTILLGAATGLYEYYTDPNNDKLINIPLPEKPAISTLHAILLLIFVLLLAAILSSVLLQIELKNISNRLKKCNTKIANFVKKEDQELLLQDTEGTNTIQNELEKIANQTKTEQVLKIIINFLTINDLKNRLNQMESHIEEKQIKRDDIIKMYAYHIHSLRNELNGEAIGNPQENASIISSNRTLQELIESVTSENKNLKDEVKKLIAYLPAEEFTSEMNSDLHDILKAKGKTKAIIEKSESFFIKYHNYFENVKGWSSTEKAVSLIYIAHYLTREKTKPQDVSEILNHKINNETASDIRKKIHSDIEDFQNTNFLLKILYDRTKSNRETS